MEYNKEQMDIIYDYCESRSLAYNKEEDIATDQLGCWEDMNGEDIIERYFDESYDWVFDDKGYEIDDCKLFLRQAKSINNENWIKCFTSLLKKFETR